MNKQRRAKLSNVCEMLRTALGIVSDVRDDEQDAIDNLPENLQESERCTAMEDAVDELEEAIDNIESAIECVNRAQS